METSKNKKSRKMLALLLTIAMIMSMIPMNIAMATNAPYTYVNGTLTITDDSWFDNVDETYKDSTTAIVFGNKVTKIDAATFVGWPKLDSVTIPDTVTTIDDSANILQGLHLILIIDSKSFFGSEYKNLFKNVKEVILTENVKIISEKAFYGWSKLENITIRGDVTTIGESAFRNCGALTAIEIPEGVTEIGEFAFQECEALKTIEIPNSVTEIGKRAFDSCVALTNIEIPEGVTKIGESVFENCTSLTAIEIPEGVTEIGESAFQECSALTAIEIPGGVTEIGDFAFLDCNSLSNLVIPDSLILIGKGSFAYCSALTNVVIPNGVTEIEYGGFTGCTELTDLTIPKSVINIGQFAFSKVVSENTRKKEKESGCDALARVYVEKGDTKRVKSLLEVSGVTNTDELTFIEPEEPAKYHRHKNIDLTDQEKAEDERNAKKLGSFRFDTASKGEHAIRTRWIASDNADGYIIYRSTEKVGNYERISKITDESILEYRDENLEANTHYYYKVASYVANTIGTKKVYSKKYLKAKRYTTK